MFINPSSSELASVDQPKYATGQRQPRNSSKLSACQICGDAARIINYGALSCQPCKTFFRRNGFHPQRIPPCLNKGTCDITKETRRFCSSCRLAKCILEGMSSDLIRKEDQRSMKHCSTSKYQSNDHTMNRSTKNNVTYDIHFSELFPFLFPESPVQFVTSNQLRFNRSLLFNPEKRILMNVAHALEIYSPISQVRDIIQDELALIFDLPFDTSSASQCISHIFTSMRCFINSIPDVRILPIHEQYFLFRRNFTNIVNLYSALVFSHTGIDHNSRIMSSFASIYGSEMMSELVHISKRLTNDSVIIKLMIVILTFSSNGSMVDYHPADDHDGLLTGTFRLLGSQDVYLTVLWKHMICQYGYEKASCVFSELIQYSLNLIRCSSKSYMSNGIYHQLVNEFDQDMKGFLIVNQFEPVRLWGVM